LLVAFDLRKAILRTVSGGQGLLPLPQKELLLCTVYPGSYMPAVRDCYFRLKRGIVYQLFC